MIKMIKPIVNVSKVIDPYNTVIIGFNGVLSDGAGIKKEAVDALIGMKRAGKHIVLLSNTSLRVSSLVKYLHSNKVPVAVFDAIITAGEILHYKFKSRQGEFAALGTTYYLLGEQSGKGVFSGLDYFQTDNVAKAEFLYMNSVAQNTDTIENYLPTLEYAASLGIPFVCAGNDTSCFINGKLGLAPGALAEAYAILGGRIITLGKPDTKIMRYALEGIGETGKIVIIGDNVATDIKAAALLGNDSVLVSKGRHVNYLGEGYIPDVAKTRELSSSYDVSPDCVISAVRW